jgi:hypothetical protein
VSPASPVVGRRALAALLALASCSSSHHAKVAAGPAREKTPLSGETNADLRLLDAGAEPRAPLRYRLSAGQHDSLVIELVTELKLSIGDMSPPAVRSPTVYAILDAAVIAGGPRIKLEGKVTKLDVPDDPAIPATVIAAVRGDLDRLAGTPWSAVFTDRGQLDLLVLPAPADANTQVLSTLDRLRDALHLLLPPLPEAPVGLNARWQVRRRAVVGPAHVDERTIYKLDATEGQPQVSLAVGMDARPQPLTMPSTPPGTKLSLTSFEAGGKGQLQLDLTDLVQPSTLRWSALGRGSATPAGEPPAPITLKIDATISVRRR